MAGGVEVQVPNREAEMGGAEWFGTERAAMANQVFIYSI